MYVWSIVRLDEWRRVPDTKGNMCGGGVPVSSVSEPYPIEIRQELPKNGRQLASGLPNGTILRSNGRLDLEPLPASCEIFARWWKRFCFVLLDPEMLSGRALGLSESSLHRSA